MTRLCCEFCGKEYKRKIHYDKHFILCEIIYRAKNKDSKIDKEAEEIEKELPSPKIMYKMLLELALKYDKLEEKMETMSKLVNKTKKKINILEWLNINSNLKPELIFDNLADNINITDTDIDLLFNTNFYDMLNEIFIKNIYDKNEIEIPLFSFIQKANAIYVYTKDTTNSELVWIELTREKLIYFLNKVHFKIVKSLAEWNKKNIDKINTSDKMAELYNKAKIKLMSVDFKHEQSLTKIKLSIYNKIKKDMKSLIEYDFEF